MEGREKTEKIKEVDIMNKFYFLFEQEDIAPQKVMVVTEKNEKVLLERKLPHDSRFSIRCANGYLNYLETRCKVDSSKLILTETDWYREWKTYMKYVAEQELLPVDDIIDFAFSYTNEDEAKQDVS